MPLTVLVIKLVGDRESKDDEGHVFEGVISFFEKWPYPGSADKLTGMM